MAAFSSCVYVFADQSLDEMKAAIRKKLKLSSESTVRLAQLRDGVRIDLEDGK